MRSTFVKIVAIIIVLHRAASGKGRKFCKTPEGQIGICQNIRNCKLLLTIMLTSGNWAGDLLRGSVCGEDGPDPLVCCPPNDVDNQTDKVDNDNKNVINETEAAIIPWSGPERKDCGLYSNSDRTPWIARLGYLTEGNIVWKCIGTLISYDFVITDAICVYNRDDLYIARLGDRNEGIEADGVNAIDVLIEKVIVHPQFDERTHVNHIAMVLLQHSIDFTDKIYRICRPVPDLPQDKDYTYSIMEEWANNPMGSAKRTFMEPLPRKQCKNFFKKFKNVTIDDDVICIYLMEDGVHVCPAVHTSAIWLTAHENAFIHGILTYGHECTNPRHPVVYTILTGFLDFIWMELINVSPPFEYENLTALMMTFP